MSHAGDLHTPLDLAPTLAALPGDPRRNFDRLAALGFRFVQLSATQPGLRPRELDGSSRRDLRATLRRRELAVSGLDLWIPESHFTDPSHMDRAISAAIAGIELAGDLGRCPISLTLPADDDYGDSQTNDAVQTVISAPHHAGVPIADHHMPVCTRAWDELLGVGIDPAAWLAAGADPASGVHEHSEHLVGARLSDLMTTGLRGPIGTADGRLDVTSYRIALSIAGYDRPIVLDARQWPNPWADIETASSSWQTAGV